MRAAFVRTVTKLLDENPKVVLLLGDISVHAFKEARDKHPLRVLNVGINEQAMVGMAAGLARAGMYPIVHTIAPFLVERAFEQLKIDFGYQGLAGCFVSVGASYDYATMGCSHHCPGDVALMLTIPGMKSWVPSNTEGVDAMLRNAPYEIGPVYIRLSDDVASDRGRSIECDQSDLLNVLVIAVGPLVRLAPRNLALFHVTHLPFQVDGLLCGSQRRFLVLEPFYRGTVTHLITDVFANEPVWIRSIGVPRRFLRDYGTREEFDLECGFTPENVAQQLEILIRG